MRMDSIKSNPNHPINLYLDADLTTLTTATTSITTTWRYAADSEERMRSIGSPNW